MNSILINLLDKLVLFLYTNFSSFIINVCLSIILSSVFISIINNSLFNPPERIQDQIDHENKIIKDLQQETPKLQFVKRHIEPPDEVSYEQSLKYQGDYEFNPDNPMLTKPITGQTLIYTLGQSGSMLSTVVPDNSTAIFKNI